MQTRTNLPPVEQTQIARAARVAAQWLATAVARGPWTPATRYACTAPLPARFVSQWDLRLVVAW